MRKKFALQSCRAPLIAEEAPSLPRKRLVNIVLACPSWDRCPNGTRQAFSFKAPCPPQIRLTGETAPPPPGEGGQIEGSTSLSLLVLIFQNAAGTNSFLAATRHSSTLFSQDQLPEGMADFRSMAMINLHTTTSDTGDNHKQSDTGWREAASVHAEAEKVLRVVFKVADLETQKPHRYYRAILRGPGGDFHLAGGHVRVDCDGAYVADRTDVAPF